MTTSAAHLAVLFFLAATGGAAPAFNPYEGPKPLAVWIQTDPWLWVIGSDVPRAVVYEDGQFVFAKVKGRREVVFLHRKLDRGELNAFKVCATAAAMLARVRPRYELANITDQPSALLYARSGDREVATEVYGFRAGDEDFPPFLRTIPKELREMQRLLATVEIEGTAPWRPRYVEAMLAPYVHTTAPALRWPGGWPGLKSERAFPRRQRQFSIYLDVALQPKLETLIGQQKDRGIEIDGAIWVVRTRPVFPGEPLWRAAFEKAGR